MIEKQCTAVKITSALLTAALLFCFHAGAACPELDPWFAQQKQRPGVASTLKEISAFKTAEAASRTQAAQAVFDSYLAARLDTPALNTCLEPLPDRQNFRNTVQSVFYSRTLEMLAKAQAGPIRNLVRRIEALTGNGIPMWRLVGHFRDESPTSMRAGFHRASGGLYMNFSEIPPEEWLITFVHEVLHSLDDVLPEAMEAYSQKDIVADIANWAHKANSLSEIPAETSQNLERWLEAGLDRGLFAEYRAWYATFVIYKQGVRERLWPEISWIEQILRGKPTGMSLSQYTYLYLDSRSPDPQDGMFSLPLVQTALQSLRAKYRADIKQPKFGSLAQLLK